MRNRSRKIIVICSVVILIFLIAFLSFERKEQRKIAADELRIENLQKLCKVWGYTKYTHPVFLKGQKDWDEELFGLIPLISSAENSGEANDILYQWLIGLGEMDFGTERLDSIWLEASEEEKHVEADTDWVSDSAYLGESLANALPQLGVIPLIARGKAPVAFDSWKYFRNISFASEKSYENMDYADEKYRLLGLFRVWNVIEYYYPYLNILDDNWNDVLYEHIGKMLEGTDQQSYDLTVLSLIAKLHDAHVMYSSESAYNNLFGQYAAPVYLTKAEGYLVVGRIHEDYQDTCALQPGDVLLRINDVSIEDVIEKCKKYLSVPNDEKLLNAASHFILKSHDEVMKVTVLRSGEELTVEVTGVMSTFYAHRFIQVNESHKLLDNNIGLINPSELSDNEISNIMDEFADTKGLIVDLRKYPAHSLTDTLGNYLLNSKTPYAVVSSPAETVPGVFIKYEPQYIGGMADVSYEKPVVLLMDEITQSFGEHEILGLRCGANVTVMGRNSVGADGGTILLTLPDGNMIRFTAYGVYTPDGGQIQRVGISPDIYVEQTIAGVREGRDEFTEAAVQYILDKDKNVQSK